MWRDTGGTGDGTKLSATRSPVARPRDGLRTVTIAMNQKGHGNRQNPFCFCVVLFFFTELDRTDVFLIYTEPCMDFIMTINGKTQY